MEDKTRQDLARRVTNGRAHKGWDQEDLAHEAGVSVRTVSRIENGQIIDPREATLRKIAAAFGVSRDELAGPRVSPEEMERAYEAQLDRLERKLGELEGKLDELLQRDFQGELEEGVDAQAGPPAHDSEVDAGG